MRILANSRACVLGVNRAIYHEPAVCRPEEALDCFMRTKMDGLVMGNWLVAR